MFLKVNSKRSAKQTDSQMSLWRIKSLRGDQARDAPLPGGCAPWVPERVSRAGAEPATVILVAITYNINNANANTTTHNNEHDDETNNNSNNTKTHSNSNTSTAPGAEPIMNLKTN